VILTIFEQVLNALGAAHEIGIIHRDMKPENIMVARAYGNPYFVKVLDFGLAKAIQDMTGFQSTLSHAGQLLGTPYYMAPEQGGRKGGGQAVDHRCDLYAVAVMLFEVFAGVRPYEGTTPLAILTKKIDPNFSPLDLPEAKALLPGLRAVIERGLQVDPERRFSSAGEMKEALKGALTGQVATASGLVWKDISSSQQKPVTPQSPAPEPVKPRDEKDERALLEKDKQQAFDVIWELLGAFFAGLFVPNRTGSATPAPPKSCPEEPSAVVTPRSSIIFWFFALLPLVFVVAVLYFSYPFSAKQQKTTLGSDGTTGATLAVSGESAPTSTPGLSPVASDGTTKAPKEAVPTKTKSNLTPTDYSGARFVDNRDGTVTDKKYGLVWSKKNFGNMTWQEAVDYCRENRGNLPGSGWHLPTIDELRTLIIGCPATEPGGPCPVSEGCRSAEHCYGGDWQANCAPCEFRNGPGPEGCYMDKAFDNPCYWYWSSTRYPWWLSAAFYVSFGLGNVGFGVMRSGLDGVRCVRAGQH
jgi:serine/threonine protein kinase